MSATANNYVYEMKVEKTSKVKEPVISKDAQKLCEQVAKKYPLKK